MDICMYKLLPTPFQTCYYCLYYVLFFLAEINNKTNKKTCAVNNEDKISDGFIKVRLVSVLSFDMSKANTTIRKEILKKTT